MQILDLKIEPEHIPTLAKWHRQEWSYLEPEETIAERIAWMSCYLSDDFVPSTFIAKSAELMGSAAIIANDMDTRSEFTPWLASVFVAPAYRRQGVGSALVSHVMQNAKHSGITKLYLFTPDREHFYQQLGWQVFSKEIYKGHVVTVMSINLLS